MKIEHIARVAHEANRAYCETLGDHSQPPWGNAPDWQRESLIRGVTAALSRKLDPEELHRLWMEEKIAAGWTHGETKDPDAKTHPCLVPYEDLPAEQKAKDVLFRSIVHAFADLGEEPE